MNWLWESWLGVRTDTQDEAIINKVQGKDAQAYEDAFHFHWFYNQTLRKLSKVKNAVQTVRRTAPVVAAAALTAYLIRTLRQKAQARAKRVER